jgi:DNA-binding response OmpR family regulator
MQKHESLSEDRRRKRILFVNDDVDTTTVIKEGLKRYGYEVETFVASNSALQNFKEGTYDLLLLDVLIKGMGAYILKLRMNAIYKNHLGLTTW